MNLTKLKKFQHITPASVLPFRTIPKSYINFFVNWFLKKIFIFWFFFFSTLKDRWPFGHPVSAQTRNIFIYEVEWPTFDGLDAPLNTLVKVLMNFFLWNFLYGLSRVTRSNFFQSQNIFSHPSPHFRSYHSQNPDHDYNSLHGSTFEHEILETNAPQKPASPR